MHGVIEAARRDQRLEPRSIVPVADNHQARRRHGLENAGPDPDERFVSFVAFPGREPADNQRVPAERRRLRRVRGGRHSQVTDADRCRAKMRIRSLEAVCGPLRVGHQHVGALDRRPLARAERPPRFDAVQEDGEARAAEAEGERDGREVDVQHDSQNTVATRGRSRARNT